MLNEVQGPENAEKEREEEGNDKDNEPEKNEKEMEKESTNKDNKVLDEVKGLENKEKEREEEMKEDGNNGKETAKTKRKKKKQIKNPCTECEKEVKKGGSLRCVGCFRDCHYICAGFENREDHERNINKKTPYQCKKCKLEINEKWKRGRGRPRRNSVPDIVLQKHMSLVDDKSLNAKESNGHKRKNS